MTGKTTDRLIKYNVFKNQINQNVSFVAQNHDICKT